MVTGCDDNRRLPRPRLEDTIMQDDIFSRLANGPLVADGAMGSLLIERGADPAGCLDALNLERPELVRAAHAQYLAAGAGLIETNTFGANPLKLARFDLAAQAAAVNEAGARLARECAGDGAFVAGSMGPPGRRGDGRGYSRDELAEAYALQAAALARGGADILMLETFAQLDAALAALCGALTAGLPAAAQMVFTAEGCSHEGRGAAECLQALAEAGAAVVGLNCGTGPQGALNLVRSLPDLGVPLSVFPNAGFPERAGDRLVYASSPEYFARVTAECAAAGARLLGGCCGTGPEHVRALAAAVAAPGEGAPARPQVRPAPRPAPRAGGETSFSARLGREKMVLVELDPPKTLDPAPALAGARALADAGVDLITVAENPLASPRMDNVTFARLVGEASGVETLLHVTGRDRNLVGLESLFMGLAALGPANVLAVTGDPVGSGASERVSGVFDARSFDLISMLSGFNQGKSPFGRDLGARAGFCIGGAFNPNTANMALQVSRLEKKAARGARFFLTQPVYSTAHLDEIAARTAHVEAAVFPGIMPLASLRNAEFLHNEFPGITIPEEIMARMRAAGDEAAEEGIAIARELAAHAWERFAGVYVIPPFNRHATAAAVIAGLPRGRPPSRHRPPRRERG